MSGADGLLTTVGIPCFLDRNCPGFGCRQDANVPTNDKMMREEVPKHVTDVGVW